MTFLVHHSQCINYEYQESFYPELESVVVEKIYMSLFANSLSWRKLLKESSHRFDFCYFKRFLGLIITLSLALFISSNAQAELTIADFTLSIDSNRHNGINEYELNKIINSQHFTPLDPKDASSYGDHWLKIEWDKSKITDETIFINDFVRQAEENYYLIKGNRVIASYSAGYNEPFNNRPIEHFKFATDVKDADYMLIKVCCNTGLPNYFRIVSETELTKDYYQHLIRYTTVYSSIFLLVLYNFFIYLYLQEKQYLFYCYYLFATCINLIAMSGIGKQFFWPNIENIQFFYFFCIINVSLSSIIFIRSFLNQSMLNRFDLRLVTLIIFMHILTLFVYFLTPYIFSLHRINNLMAQSVVVFSWLTSDYLIIKNLIKGDRSAWVLLISFGLVNIAVVILILRFNGIIPDIPATTFFVDASILLEAIILSLALAQKIQKLRVQKTEAEKKQLQIQQEYSQQLLQVQEDEKKQLGSALHDNFTHELLILKSSISKKIGKNTEETQHVDQILNDIRNISHLVHPYMLEKLGLKEALFELVANLSDIHGLDIDIAFDSIELTQQQSLIVYRIVQEALNNIIKHAHSDECVISVSKVHSEIQIIIKDDGKGFDDSVTEGFGIKTIKERANMLSGNVDFHSDEFGTQMLLKFPYR